MTYNLGIGANAAILGLIDGLWFHPMGVPQPGQMMRIFSVTSQDSEGLFSYPEYKAIAEQSGAPRADRQTGAHFRSPSRGPGQQQAGHVRARCEQHQAHHDCQDRQRTRELFP